MASAAQPQPGQEQQQPQGGDPLQEFRELGQRIMELGKKYPETAQEAAGLLRGIQQMMTKVSGNPQRTQEKQAPPMA